MNIRLGAVVVALCVAGGACSDDGGPSAEQADAIRRYLDADIDDDEATCLIEGLAEIEVPIEELADTDLAPDDDTAVLAATLGCVEDLTIIPSFIDAFIAGASEQGLALTEEQAQCAIEATSATDAATAITECVDAGATIDDNDAGAPGDPLIDLLRERCGSGNNQACDELYLAAPIGSEDETFARTCGGRREPAPGATCFDDLG